MARPPKSARSPRRSLALRLVVVAALAVVLTALLGTAALIFLAAPWADGQGREELTRGASAHAWLQQDRLLRLRLMVRLLAEDPELPALLAGAAESGAANHAAIPAAATPASEEEGAAAQDPVSWLLQRRGGLGFDLALLVDPSGRVVARSDGAATAGRSLAGSPLLAAPPAASEVAGAWADGGRLYYAAASAVVRDFDLVGYAVAAFAVDELLALEIVRMSGAEVAFVAAGAESPRLVGASHDAAPAEALLERLGRPGGELSAVLSGAEPSARVRAATAAGRRSEVLAVPLADAAGSPLGAVLFWLPLGGGAGHLPLSLAGLGAAALVVFAVVVPLALWLGRRAGAPAERMEVVLAAARRGDYEHRVEAKKAGAFATAAAALDGLMGDLQEQESLAAITDAALAGSGELALGVVEAEETQAVLLGVDLGRYALGQAGSDPREIAERLSRDLRRIETAVAARDGRIETVAGQRAVASFAGADRAVRALGAGAEILATLSRRESAFDEAEPPAVAAAAGRVVRGAATLAGAVTPTLVGSPLLLLDGLLREAGPGELVLAPPVYRELSARLEASGVEAVTRRGLLAPQPLFALTAAAAARAAGLEAVGGGNGEGEGDKEEREEPAATADEGADSWDLPAEPLVASPADLAPGDRLGERFEILSLLGTSSAGALFRARDHELGEAVALKVFTPGLLTDRTQFERVDSVLRGLRQLVHPNIARTYDFGRVGGLGYIAREFVHGVPLAELFARDEAMRTPAALRMLRQLASALALAHRDGMVHGRLGPRNLILQSGGRLRATDFGVGRVIRPGAPAESAGAVAPEQIAGRPADPRSDVYAAAALLRRAVTGAWPAPRHDAGAGDGQGAGALRGELAAVVARCLDPDPAARYADGGELVHALEGVRA